MYSILEGISPTLLISRYLISVICNKSCFYLPGWLGVFVNIGLSQHAKSMTNTRRVTELEEERREARRDGRPVPVLFVLTRGHIYNLGVHAKVICHGAGHRQVGGGHHFDLVRYLAVDEGTLVELGGGRQ